MVKWVVKYELDGNGDKTNFQVCYRADRGRPRKGLYMSMPGPDVKHAKVELDANGRPQVVEDLAMKAQKDQEKLDKQAKYDALQAFLSTYVESDLKTIAGIRPVITLLLESVDELLKER